MPRLGISINDWMFEIKARNKEFKWLTHLIVLQDHPIGLCQCYKCEDSKEYFGILPLTGSCGIDYPIEEESYIDKDLGKRMVALLVDKIFSFPDAQKVTVGVDKDSKASEKALLSCGFVSFDAKRSRYIIIHKGVHR